MRVLITEFFNEDECQSLLGIGRSSDFSKTMQIPAFKRIIDLVQSCVPEKLKLEKPSYYSIENKPKGHPKHYDGCKLDFSPNHMAWCRYSAVSVISNDFEGGTLRFYNPDQSFDNFYRNVIVYSSSADNDPQLHSRDEFEGRRDALLLFFAVENIT